jgi:hypothetical protein
MNNVKLNKMNLMRSKMLTVLFSMLISALLLLPLFSSAKGREKNAKAGSVYMQPLNKDYHAAVTLANLEEGKYTLTIESGNGVNVYYDALLNAPEQFSKVFDFSRLDDGEYTLRLKSNNGLVERHFDIVEGKIKVYYNENTKPEFKVMGQKALFSLPNTGKMNYNIRIYNNNGEELYSAKENSATIKKMFDFSKVETGNYKILVSSKNNEFAFDFANGQQ